jgi:hypothetical protein
MESLQRSSISDDDMELVTKMIHISKVVDVIGFILAQDSTLKMIVLYEYNFSRDSSQIVISSEQVSEVFWKKII